MHRKKKEKKRNMTEKYRPRKYRRGKIHIDAYIIYIHTYTLYKYIMFIYFTNKYL